MPVQNKKKVTVQNKKDVKPKPVKKAARNLVLQNKLYQSKSMSNTKILNRKLQNYQIGQEIFQNPLIKTVNIKDLNWNSLPKQFVIKSDTGCSCNRVKCLVHQGGENYLDLIKKQKIDRAKLIKFFQQVNNGQVLIEKMVTNPHRKGIPRDYKLYVAHDEVLFVRVIDRNTHPVKIGVFHGDTQERIPHLKWFYPDVKYFDPLNKGAKLPKSYEIAKEKAIQICQKLDVPFVSVDLYIFDDQIYLGELTFTPGPLQFDHFRESYRDYICKKIDEKREMILQRREKDESK